MENLIIPMDLFQDGFDSFGSWINEQWGEQGLAGGPPTAIEEIPRGLADTISACFKASLSQEELNPTRFNVVLAPPEIAHKFGGGITSIRRQWDYDQLADARPLTSDNIRKLAVALDETKSSLLVWSGQSEGPVIWGIQRTNDVPSAMDTLHEPESGVMKPRVLCIRAVGPGRLLLGDSFSTFLELNGGKLSDVTGISIRAFEDVYWSPLLRHVEIAARLSLNSTVPYLRHDFDLRRGAVLFNKVWRVYTATIVHILRAMYSHGCGGTLLVAPQQNAVDGTADSGFRCKPSQSDSANDGAVGGASLLGRLRFYLQSVLRTDPDAMVNQQIERIDLGRGDLQRNEESGNSTWATEVDGTQLWSFIQSVNSDVSKHFYHWASLVQAARAVGRLSAADGAVIMDSSLQLLSFGAKLKTDGEPQDDLFSVTSESLSQTARKAESLNAEGLKRYGQPRGMRFISAVSFVKLVEGAVAFVASVDGPISMIWKDPDGRVLVVDPLDTEY